MKAFFMLIFAALICANLFKTFSAKRDTDEYDDYEKDDYDDSVFYKTIQFKNSMPSEPDEKRCTYVPVKTKERQYITGFIPDTNKEVAHHMVLSGCRYLPEIDHFQENGNSWDCGRGGICGDDGGDKLQKIFSWALDAEGINFPPDTGFRIGGDTDINYIVLQIHYAHNIKEPDNSRLTLKMTSKPLKYQVATYTIGGDGYVPPRTKEFHMDTACRFDQPYDMYPMYYRTHSHHLGDVTSGYVIKHGKWIELGRMSPRQPQMFYKTTHPGVRISNGDIIASRCTMNSLTRSDDTWMGPTNKDEMCVFYLMFYTDYPHTIESEDCFENANKYSWAKDSRIKTHPPKTVSSLKGVKLVDPEAENDLDPYSD